MSKTDFIRNFSPHCEKTIFIGLPYTNMTNQPAKLREISQSLDII